MKTKRKGQMPRYLQWVREQECVMCGAPADEAHHLIGVGLGGMGTKAPDIYTIPVCRGHHEEIHRTPELWPQQWEWMALTVGKAVRDGVLGVKERV